MLQVTEALNELAGLVDTGDAPWLTRLCRERLLSMIRWRRSLRA